MDSKVVLTEREKICSNCGGILEVIEVSEETWVLEGKEYLMKIITLRCIQCRKEYTIKKNA